MLCWVNSRAIIDLANVYVQLAGTKKGASSIVFTTGTKSSRFLTSSMILPEDAAVTATARAAFAAVRKRSSALVFILRGV